MDRVSLHVMALAAVEDQVGREKKEGDIPGQGAQVARRVNVKCRRPARISLAGGAPSEPGTVQDQRRWLGVKRARDGVEVQQIKALSGQGDNLPVRSKISSRPDQRASDEASGTGDPYDWIAHESLRAKWWAVRCNRFFK